MQADEAAAFPGGLASDEAGASGPAGGADEEAVAALLARLRATEHTALRGRGGGLAWMRVIDVEQALCEYSKYVRYLEQGVGSSAYVHTTLTGAGIQS